MMACKKKEPNRINGMLDDILANCQGTGDVLGESGMLKQFNQRLVERV